MGRKKWTKQEVEEYRKIHSVYFYYNKDDSNFLVPKAYGFGRAFNWANPISWVLILAVIALIIFRVFFQ